MVAAAVAVVVTVAAPASAAPGKAASAENKVKTAQSKIKELSERSDRLQHEFFANKTALEAAKRRLKAAEARYQTAKTVLDRQAASIVRSGGSSLEVILGEPADEAAERIEFLDVVVNRQGDSVQETRQSREAYEAVVREIGTRAQQNRRLIADLKDSRTKLTKEFEKARAKVIAKGGSANGDGFKTNLVSGGRSCPLGQPRHFSDTWGAARSNGRSHKGTDMFAPVNAPVYAYSSGTVTRAGDIGGNAGLGVMIRHAGGIDTWYFHFNAVKARTGATVKAGDRIGSNGSTGNAEVGAEHVHFEYHVNGTATNPYQFARAACS